METQTDTLADDPIPASKGVKLYQNLLKEGYNEKNLGTQNEFLNALSDPVKSAKIYNGLRGDGYNEDNLGKISDFQESFKKKTSAQDSNSTLPSLSNGGIKDPSFDPNIESRINPDQADPFGINQQNIGIGNSPAANPKDRQLFYPGGQEVTIKDTPTKPKAYPAMDALYKNLSPEEQKTFAPTYDVATRVTNTDGLREPSADEVSHQKFMDSNWGKVIKPIAYIGSKLTKGTTQIAKGAAYVGSLINPNMGAAYENAFELIDPAANVGLTKKDQEDAEQSKVLQGLGGFAELAPAAMSGGGMAAFGLQGMGSTKEVVDNLEKQGLKLNSTAKNAFILGGGVINAALMGDLGNSLFGKIPNTLKQDILGKLSLESIKEAAGKDITGDGYMELLKNKTMDFSQKLQQGGLNYLSSYKHTLTDLGAYNVANFALKTGVDAINDKPVFNENLGSLAEQLNETATHTAPMFAAAGSAKDLTKLFPNSSYNNAIVESLNNDSSPENADQIKQDLYKHGFDQNKPGGQWTPQEMDASFQHIDKLAAIAKSLPKGMPERDFGKAVDLINGRNELSDKLADIVKGKETLDPAIKDIPTPEEEMLTAKIEQANDKLGSLVKGGKITYSKDNENDKFYKTVDGKKEQISLARYQLEDLERQPSSILNEPTVKENLTHQQSAAEKVPLNTGNEENLPKVSESAPLSILEKKSENETSNPKQPANENQPIAETVHLEAAGKQAEINTGTDAKVGQGQVKPADIEQGLADFSNKDQNFNALQEKSQSTFQEAQKLQDNRLKLLKQGKNVDDISNQIEDLRKQGNGFHDESMALLDKEKQRLVEEKQKAVVPKENTSPKNEPLSSSVVDMPIAKIKTDEASFQSRDNLDEGRVTHLVDNFDKNKLDPIVVYKKGEDYTVLSGHHRFEAMKRMGEENIPVKVFDGTEQEAKDFAKDSNTLSKQETPTERAKRYKEMRDSGISEAQIKERARQAHGSDANKIVNLSRLDPKGKAIDTVKQFEESTDVDTKNKVQAVADWIGQVKSKYPDVSRRQENEMFDYLMDTYSTKKGAGKITNKLQFVDLADAMINRAKAKPGFDAGSVLNLKNKAGKTGIEIEYDHALEEAKQNVTKAQKTLADKREELLSRGAKKEDLDRILPEHETTVQNALKDLENLKKQKGALENAVQAQQSIFDVIHNEKVNETPNIEQQISKEFGFGKQPDGKPTPDNEAQKIPAANANGGEPNGSSAADSKPTDKPANKSGTAASSSDTVKEAVKTTLNSEKAKVLADKIRALKSDKNKAYDGVLGIPVALYDGALETAATVIEAGGKIADAINAAVAHIKEKMPDADLNAAKEKLEKDFEGLGEERSVPDESAMNKAAVAENRDALRLNPLGSKEKLNEDAEYQAASKKVDAGLIDPKEIANKIISDKSGKYIPSIEEANAMIYHNRKIDNQYQEALIRQAESLASKDYASQKEAEGALVTLDAAKDLFHLAADRVTTRWGYLGRIFQKSVDKDYKLSSLRTLFRAKFGGELPKEVEEKLAKLVEERDQATKDLKDYQDNQSKRDAQSVIDKEARKQNLEARSTKRKVNIEEINKSIGSEFEAMRKSLKKLRGQLNANPIPVELLGNVSKMVILYVKKGIINAADIADHIYENLKDDIDGLKKRDVIDAIAGNIPREQKTLSDFERQKREAKTQAKLIARLEDIESGKTKPPKNLSERSDFNQETQRLRDEVHKAILDAKIPPTDGERLTHYKELLQKRVEEAETKIKNGDYSKPDVKLPLGLDQEAMTLKTRLKRATRQIDELGKELDPAKAEKLKKFFDGYIKIHRSFLLSRIGTLLKLYGAAAGRMVTTPIEEVLGKLNSYIPGIKNIAKLAPRHGRGFTSKAEISALSQRWSKATLKDSWNVIKGEGSELDELYNDKHEKSNEISGILGRAHGAMKNSTKRAEYFRSFTHRMLHAKRMGLDINDPVLQREIGEQSYKDAKNAIFMGDNMLTDAYSNLLNYTESKHGDAGKIAAFVGRLMFPIVKIPTNFALETFDYAGGAIPRAAVPIFKAMIHGAESLSSKEADFVMRQLKKGELGLAFVTIGFLNPANFGGFYDGKKRKKGDLAAEDLKLFGHQVPHIFLHNPAIFAMQAGSTLARSLQESEHRTTDLLTHASAAKVAIGIKESWFGIAENLPFLSSPSDLSKALKSENAINSYIGSAAKNQLIPGAIQEQAEQSDTKNGSKFTFTPENAQKRKPETKTLGQSIIQNLESGIPVLRKEVPKKDESGLTSSQIKSFSTFTQDKKRYELPEAQVKTIYERYLADPKKELMQKYIDNMSKYTADKVKLRRDAEKSADATLAGIRNNIVGNMAYKENLDNLKKTWDEGTSDKDKKDAVTELKNEFVDRSLKEKAVKYAKDKVYKINKGKLKVFLQ